MLTLLAKFILWIAGWKVKGSVPVEIKKAVIIAAPHTSYWDFLYARCAFFIIGLNMKATIKKEAVDLPIFGWILRQFGAIAVDRTPKSGSQKKKLNMVDAMVNIIESHDQMIMMVTPEGTRKYAARWKSGFYRVAEQANVPIILGFLDYATKTAGIGPVFYPTGDYEKDLEEIQAFYREKQGKYPDQGVR